MTEDLKKLNELSTQHGAQTAILVANRYLRACGYSVAADTLLAGADQVLDQVKDEIAKVLV